uniref:Uncharacterized protein n=1 Tax=Amphimedon queenslandica TaxID=400682 RepID=A0A1X7USR4_AMPQE
GPYSPCPPPCWPTISQFLSILQNLRDYRDIFTLHHVDPSSFDLLQN